MSFIEETLAASSSVGGLPSTPRSPFVKVPLWSNARMYKSFEYPSIITEVVVVSSDREANATKENAAWQAAENEIERIQNLIDELTYESMSEDTRAGKKAQYEEDIKTQERIQSREAGKESGIDATRSSFMVSKKYI